MTKQITKKKPGRSPARADWKFAGAEIPPELDGAINAEVSEVGVPRAVVIRWALESYLSDRLKK
jgi:hypothetical protein